MHMLKVRRQQSIDNGLGWQRKSLSWDTVQLMACVRWLGLSVLSSTPLSFHCVLLKVGGD